MPELAELRLTADYVNQVAENKIFYGVRKNPVHKGKDVEVPFNNFTIKAESRGKELMLTLTELNSNNQVKLLMGMGMSGHFKWIEAGVLSKHSHLRFQSEAGSLDFVDVRRFGGWKVATDWSANRGPDPTVEYKQFYNNVVNNLDKTAFLKPICEVLMNQQYFNGIGNYLRAEILLRADIDPFAPAKVAIKEAPEILELCRTLPLKAYELGGGQLKDWDNPFGDLTDMASWDEFMLCYGNPNMSHKKHKGRTIWYHPKFDQAENWCEYSDLPSPLAYQL
jgi:endonuclease VIII-like 1